MLKPKAHFSCHALLKVFVCDFMCVWFDNCSDLWRKWFDLCESAGANEPDWGRLKRMCEGDVMQELFMCSDNSSIGSEEHTHMYSAEFTEGHEGIEEALDVMT